MAIIRLTIEYDGTAYAGWQRQPNHPTIQAVLEEALFRVTQEHIPIVAAGRTDSGVHALGQAASFQSNKSLPGAQWSSALNNYLPKDISVRSSEQVQEDFHARFSAKGKTYEYRMTLRSSRPALDRYRTWHIPYVLDTEAMKQSLPEILGTHDFSSFRGQRSQTKNPICTITDLSLDLEGSSLKFRIEGDRFLKQMVRAIVGTLVEIGLHKRRPGTISDVIHARNRRAAGRTAPPHGLYLTKVKY